MTESLIGFGVLLFLAFLRMPLGLALGLVGGVGLAFVTSERAAIASAARLVIDYDKFYTLSVLPMFILMGLLVERGGMARELYRAAYAFLGHRRGGQTSAGSVRQHPGLSIEWHLLHLTSPRRGHADALWH